MLSSIKNKSVSSFIAIVISLLICALLIVCVGGCGGGGGSGGNNIVTPSVYKVIKGRAIIPYGSDPSFHQPARTSSYDNLDIEGIPLINADVTVTGTDITTKTDSNGMFTLTNVPFNDYIEITIVKNHIKLLKIIDKLQPSAEINVNINYQTTVASLAFLKEKQSDSDNDYLDIEIFEKANIISNDLPEELKNLLQCGAECSDKTVLDNPEFISEIEFSRDLFPPIFKDLNFTKQSVKKGETLKANLSIYESVDIKSVFLILCNIDDCLTGKSINIASSNFLSYYDNKTGLWRIELPIEIPYIINSGTYGVRIIYVYDTSNNTSIWTGIDYIPYYYYKGAGEFVEMPTIHIEEEYIDNDNEMVKYILNDKTPPILIEASITPEKVSNPDENIKLKISCKDEDSLVSDISYSIYDSQKNVNTGHYSVSKSKFDENTGIYTIEMDIYGGSFEGNGIYTLGKIEIEDIVGNKAIYGNEEFIPNPTYKLEPITFEIDYLPDDFLEIKEIAVTPLEINPGEPFTITLKIKDSISEVSNASIEFPQFESNIKINKFTFNSNSGLWEGTSEQIYESDFLSGIYKLEPDYVWIYDNKSRSKYYSKAEDDFKNINPPQITIVSNPKEDKMEPKIIDLYFESETVKVGDSIFLKVKIQERGSGLKKIDGYLRKVECEDIKNLFCRLSFYADIFNFDEANSIWETDVEIPIHSKQVTGKWQLNGVRFYDFSNNVKYYSSIELSQFFEDKIYFDVEE